MLRASSTEPTRPQRENAAHLVAAEVLSSIDGRSGIDQIVDGISTRLALSRHVTKTAVMRYLPNFVSQYVGNPMLSNG